MEIIGIIPARKGSKRLPQKNIRSLNGKPIVEYTIEEAKKSSFINNVYITTDDKEVMKIAERRRVIYRERPKELCTDTATMEEVIDDMLNWLPNDRQPDVIVLLQPTSPLRTFEDIDKCVLTLLSGNFDSVISGVRLPTFHTFIPNGAVYVIRKGKQRYGDNMCLVTMPQERSVDIDTKTDFLLAKVLASEKKE